MNIQIDTTIVMGCFAALGVSLAFAARRLSLLRDWVNKGQWGNRYFRSALFAFTVFLIVVGLYGYGRLIFQLESYLLLFASLSMGSSIIISAVAIYASGRLYRRGSKTPLSDGLRAAPAKRAAERARRSAQRRTELNVVLQRENLLMADKMRLAAQIQEGFAHGITICPHVALTAWWRPCQIMTGDMVYSWSGGGEDGKAFNIFIGDAAGKGVSAGLLTVAAYACLQNMHADLPPEKVLLQLNKVLQTKSADLFMTGVVVRIELTGRISYANAGHPFPIIIRQDGRTEGLAGAGLPMGMFDSEFEVEATPEANLHDGDRLALVTDGVLELGERHAPESFLGMEGIENELANSIGVDSFSALKSAVRKVEQFAKEANCQIDDDSMIVLLDYKPKGEMGVAADPPQFSTNANSGVTDYFVCLP